MKKYKMVRYYVAMQTVELLAENYNEALDTVKNMDCPCGINNIQFVPTEDEPEIVSSEDLEEDLDELIEKAEEIVTEYYEKEDCYLDSKSNPSFTMNVQGFNECNVYDEWEECKIADSYYIESDEIKVVCRDESEYYLSELDDVVQLEICRDIIESKI